MKSLEEFENDILKRWTDEMRLEPGITRGVSDTDAFFIRELAMLNHFVHHALNGVSEQLAKMQSDVSKAINEIKYPNRSIQ